MPWGKRINCRSNRFFLWRKLVGKSQEYHDVIVLKRFVFKLFSVHTTVKRKASTFKLLQFEERFQTLGFRDGLVWTVGLTVEKKLRFRDGLVWTAGLTVEIKLCFRDGLVWTVGLAVEIKLCFRDGLVWTVSLTVEIELRFQIPPSLCGRCLTH